MDQDTRNKLQRATQQVRRILEEEFAEQLEGTFDVLPNGKILPEPGRHLDARQRLTRQKLVDAIEHIKAGAKTPQEAVDEYTREAAFTFLNRFVALRMLESRGMLQECVSKGDASSGFREFCGLAPGLSSLDDGGYRLYLECLFDELSVEVKVLFDRRDSASMLWPRRGALTELLEILGQADLTGVWSEDETIGWVYQYCNSGEERKKMREESSAPRNSRELAVRNQFFTPRYVVEFLTDNTLGRIWYEMQQGDTHLVDACKYLVRRPNEVFLSEAQEPPAEDNSVEEDLNQEDLLKKAVYIPHRVNKDPRDLKILDPACGSGHFLLYAFDLLIPIYEEAWHDEASAKSEITGKRLRDDYPELKQLHTAIPRLVMAHNLHGIDIDPRAAQIAALALWMRGQRAYSSWQITREQRSAIARSNIVCAEPMPGEGAFLDEFIAEHLSNDAEGRFLASLVRKVFDAMKLAGEAGSLLKIEEDIAEEVAKAKKQWLDRPEYKQQNLFEKGSTIVQKELDLTSGITDESFWEEAEHRIYDALRTYSEQTEQGGGFQRRLFATDTARGFAFVDVSRKRFDVILMNPPFGAFCKGSQRTVTTVYPSSLNDIYTAFIDRALRMLIAPGLLGALTPRSCFFVSQLSKFRHDILVANNQPVLCVDLGEGVLDDAVNEVACYTMSRQKNRSYTLFVRCVSTSDKPQHLADATTAASSGTPHDLLFPRYSDSFAMMADSPYCYWVDGATARQLSGNPPFEPASGFVRQGIATTDGFKFVRLVPEVPNEAIIAPPSSPNAEGYGAIQRALIDFSFDDGRWAFHVKAGASQPWYSPLLCLIDWRSNGRAIKKQREEKRQHSAPSEQYYFLPGFSWTLRSTRLIPYLVPAGAIPSASRYEAFPKNQYALQSLGVVAANVSSAFARCYGEKFIWPKFLVDNVRSVPFPQDMSELPTSLASFVAGEIERRQSAYRNYEPFQEFTIPALVYSYDEEGGFNYEESGLLPETLEIAVGRSLGLDKEAAEKFCQDLYEALEFRSRAAVGNDEADADDDSSREFAIDTSHRGKFEQVLSYAIGCLFGRWDVRIALKPSLAPNLPQSLQVVFSCPPGMLLNPQGLPARNEHDVASENWLDARNDVYSIPACGNEKACPESAYPLPIEWSGILTDDAGRDDDIISRTNCVIELIWRERSEAIEKEACDVLGVKSLRDYFRKPGKGGFWDDHIRRYSKCRRKAPIYWQVATSSSSYSVWLYYHRLSKDTFFQVLKEYVKPKQIDEQKKLDRIRNEAGGEPTRSQRKVIEDQEKLVGELAAMLEEVERIAPLWNPNLNDGVIINFAPLWRLVPQNKSWQKECKKVWDKLVKGEYDWAHLAMHLWPERVVPKCVTDASLAIAHGLDELLWVTEADEKLRPLKKPEEELADQILLWTSRNRTKVENGLSELSETSHGKESASSVYASLGNGQHDENPAALFLWPDRVIKKCFEDRTLRKTHGLILPAKLTEKKKKAFLETYVYSDCSELRVLLKEALATEDRPFAEVWSEFKTGVRDEDALSPLLWPERVIGRCDSDHHLAVTHGIERYLWHTDRDGTARRRQPIAEEVASEIDFRTSPAVKAALESLLNAPAPAASSRKRKTRTSGSK